MEPFASHASFRNHWRLGGSLLRKGGKESRLPCRTGKTIQPIQSATNAILMKQQGTIQSMTPTETFGAKGFRKRLLIVERDTQYDRIIALEVVQDDCDKFNDVTIGSAIEFEYAVSSREYMGKWYTQARLTNWEIEDVETEDEQPF